MTSIIKFGTNLTFLTVVYLIISHRVVHTDIQMFCFNLSESNKKKRHLLVSCQPRINKIILMYVTIGKLYMGKLAATDRNARIQTVVNIVYAIKFIYCYFWISIQSKMYAVYSLCVLLRHTV